VNMTNEQIHKLNRLRDYLNHLHKLNLVKINHSVMELVCSKYLIQKDYSVELEYALNEILTCDLFGKNGNSTLVVEIETGFIPPEHALDPLTYTYTRIASKIVRYSNFAEKFVLGIPAHYLLPLPEIFISQPNQRSDSDIELIKNLCDYFYQNPPLTEEDIKKARIDEIYIIDVDRTNIQVITPASYIERAINAGSLFTLHSDQILNQPLASNIYLTNKLDDEYTN
ncbi:MAG: hypothetical protein GX638_06675, partial [Crenarchaeota archaeon]|nr:hypothetical protein [Thermoproteota archaeon]